MAFFYPPPPPSQGPVNSTLPIPHTILATPPDQPPFRPLRPPMALWWWPSDLEPRLTAPNNQQVKNAAVIPAPPVSATPYVRPLTHIYASWDTYELEVVTTFTIGPDNPDQPKPSGPLTPTEFNLLVRSWDPPPPPRQPGPSVVWIQPPSPYTAIGPISATNLSTIAQQWVQTWPAQTKAPWAAWFKLPDVHQVMIPPPPWIWAAWIPPAPYPPRPIMVATAAIPPPSPPPPGLFLSASNRLAIAQWTQTWAAQSVEPSQTPNFTFTFQPDWAQQVNQYLGPNGFQSVTH